MDGPANMAARYGEELFDVLNGEAVDGTDRYAPSDRILDVGSSDSFGVPYMTDADVVQIDTDPSSLYQGQDRAAELREQGYNVEAERIVADGHDLPFQDDSFDTVVACASLHDARSQTGVALAYSDIPDVLEEGGRLVIGSGHLSDTGTTDEAVAVARLDPLADHFNSIYRPADKILVLDDYNDPDTVTEPAESLTIDELDDLTGSWDGDIVATDPTGFDQPYNSDTDIRDWVSSELHILSEQYPRFQEIEPAAIEPVTATWRETNIDGEQYALAQIILEDEQGAQTHYQLQFMPADD